MGRTLITIGCLLSLASSLSKSLDAQGLSSLVGGAAASPTSIGPHSVFWNPATLGMTSPELHVEAQGGLMGGWLIYDRSGTDPNTSSPYASSETGSQGPYLFLSAVSPLGTEDFRFSYATYFPSGLMAEFNEHGSQRYDLISGMMIPWHHQLTLAYRPSPHWSVALGGILSVGIFETELDVDLGKMMQTVLQQEQIISEHPALSARAQVPRTTTVAFGGIAGLFFKPSPQWALGFSATSPIRYQFSGTFRLRPPEFTSVLGAAMPALGIEDPLESKMSAKTILPACLQLGVRFQPKGYWIQDYFGRYVLSGLSKSLSLRIRESPVEVLKNVDVPGQQLNDAFLVGTTHTFSLYSEWTLGLLGTYYQNSVSDENVAVSRVDFNALTLGGFLKFYLSNRWSLGAEYSHSFLFSREINSSRAVESSSSFFQPPKSTGSYRAGIDRAAVVVRFAL